MIAAVPAVSREFRALPRRRIYLGEGLTFELTCRGRTVAAEAIDMTLEGLGLALTSAPVLPLAGEIVRVRYVGRGSSGATQEAVVTHVGSLRSGSRVLPRIGLSLLGERAEDPGVRWPCPDALPAFAVANCPCFYRERARFRITSLGARGMTLNSEHTALLRGLEVEFDLHLPFVGVETVRARVLSARDVEWVEPPRTLHNALARYLLATDDALSPARLRAGGLQVGSIEHAVTVDYATTTADREAILALRLRAHQAEGHLRDATIDDLRSVYDAHARHLVCRFGERIVGYVRLIFVDRHAARSQYVSLGDHEVPPWLWNAGFAEAGAGAIDPEFQGAGLFTPLMAHAIRVAVQAGYRYVLGACDDGLVAMYDAMGFAKLEARVCEPKPGWRFRSHLIYLDAERVPPAIASAVAFAQDVVQAPPQGAYGRRSVA